MPLTCGRRCCVAGPSGYTIREIIKQTGADVKSWTDKMEDDLTRPTRTFIIEVRQPGNPQLRHESWPFLRCQECFAVNFTGAGSDSLQCVQGHPDSVATALRIICDGIARYKELCEGAYNGMPSSSPSLHMYNQEKGFDFFFEGCC